MLFRSMQSIMAKILDEILKSEATEQIKAKAYERSDERTNSRQSFISLKGTVYEN